MMRPRSELPQADFPSEGHGLGHPALWEQGTEADKRSVAIKYYEWNVL